MSDKTIKIDIEAVKKLLKMSKQDIFPEDFIGEKGIDEESEKAEMIYELFGEISNYVIERLELRLLFMKLALEDQSKGDE